MGYLSQKKSGKSDLFALNKHNLLIYNILKEKSTCFCSIFYRSDLPVEKPLLDN